MGFYHLTDCPSFISGGETLCVLDPHRKYVPEAEGEESLPGARYDELERVSRYGPSIPP